MDTLTLILTLRGAGNERRAQGAYRLDREHQPFIPVGNVHGRVW